jgi:carboxylesterase type B
VSFLYCSVAHQLILRRLGFPQGNDAAAQGNLNLGLKDQIAALQWIQANIGVFGGDKSKVTVFGESAGAISLAILMLNPDFKKLARAAVREFVELRLRPLILSRSLSRSSSRALGPPP